MTRVPSGMSSMKGVPSASFHWTSHRSTVWGDSVRPCLCIIGVSNGCELPQGGTYCGGFRGGGVISIADPLSDDVSAGNTSDGDAFAPDVLAPEVFAPD